MLLSTPPDHKQYVNFTKKNEENIFLKKIGWFSPNEKN